MTYKISFTLLIAFLFCQLTYGQVKKYTPTWKNYLGQTPEGRGEINSSGSPIGLWSFYASGGGEALTETFNYKNNTLTCYGKSGNVSEKGRLNSDFKRTGIWREYMDFYGDNILDKKGKYYDGMKHGTWDLFNLDSLTPAGYENYTNGVPSGRWVRNDHKGDVMSEENFKNGKYDGIVIITGMFGNGYQKMESTYSEGVKNGIEKVYIIDEESTILQTTKGSYLNGEKVGDWHSYNSNGELEETIVYPATFTDGSPIEVKRYYPIGEVLSTVPIQDFKKQGTFTQYHLNGLVYAKLRFEKDNIMDVIAMKDANGKPLDGGNLSGGNGTLNEYDDAGILIKVVDYEKSSIVSTEYYENGELKGIIIDYEGENNRKEIYYEGGQIVTELEVINDNASVSHFENSKITKKEVYFREKLVKTILYENGIEVKSIEKQEE